MNRWNASVQETFDDIPRSVRRWRNALLKASQAIDETWKPESSAVFGSSPRAFSRTSAGQLAG